MAYGNISLLNIGLREWLLRKSANKVELFDCGDQLLFHNYGLSGGLMSSACVVLVLRGAGRWERLDGGEIPSASEGIVRDIGGHYICRLDFTMEELHHGVGPAMTLIDATATEMQARWESDPLKVSALPFKEKMKFLLVRTKRKIAAFRAA